VAARVVPDNAYAPRAAKIGKKIGKELPIIGKLPDIALA